MSANVTISTGDLKFWRQKLLNGNSQDVINIINKLVSELEDDYLTAGQWITDKSKGRTAKVKESAKKNGISVRVDDEAFHSFSIEDSEPSTEREITLEISRRRKFNNTYYKNFNEEQLTP